MPLEHGLLAVLAMGKRNVLDVLARAFTGVQVLGGRFNLQAGSGFIFVLK